MILKAKHSGVARLEKKRITCSDEIKTFNLYAFEAGHGISIAFEDITPSLQVKQAMEQLSKEAKVAQKAKSEFLSK